MSILARAAGEARGQTDSGEGGGVDGGVVEAVYRVADRVEAVAGQLAEVESDVRVIE